MPAVNCPICANPLACAHCGQHLDAGELAEQLGDNLKGRPLHGTDTGEARGSAGRQPMWDTSPRARTAYLDSLDVRGRAQAVESLADQEQGDVPPFIARLAAAERLVEACESDREAAYAELIDAQADEPEQYHYRALTDEQVEACQRVTRARAAASRTESALENARLRLARDLEAFDQASKPLPAFTDDGPGLSAIDRDRRY